MVGGGSTVPYNIYILKLLVIFQYFIQLIVNIENFKNFSLAGKKKFLAKKLNG